VYKRKWRGGGTFGVYHSQVGVISRLWNSLFPSRWSSLVSEPRAKRSERGLESGWKAPFQSSEPGVVPVHRYPLAAGFNSQGCIPRIGYEVATHISFSA
jgi:hypothetical protein